MSPIEQAFLAKVGRSGVSDTAFKFALMVVPMLGFVSWQTLFLGDVAKRVGLSRQEVAIAASELVAIGAFERRHSRFAARKLQSPLLRATWILEGRTATLQEAPFIGGRLYLIAYP
ncbi:hypothetical protein [Burkholderia sp. BCC0405]|uniref:hypothetical protein n=1 Tax=Burkholderia sp. BCC0405 TaxID=2676298 RepID=UPI00158D7A47|nr:hypothetical protein [Burkholderia sp. BCC0405]